MAIDAREPAALTALEQALQDERGALIENNVEALLRASDAKLNALRVLEADPSAAGFGERLALLAEMNRENGQLLSRRRRVVDWTLRQLGRQGNTSTYDAHGGVNTAPRGRALGVV